MPKNTLPSFSFDANEIVFEEHYVDSDTAGIKLHVRNKRRKDHKAFLAEKTIVMVHGATFSSGSLYDVPFSGMSFIDFLAHQGFDVFAVDVRGYGKSSRPPEMQVKPDLNPPLVATDTGVTDFATAVDFVLRLRDLRAVNIFAMSWGGTVAGAYAASNGDKVVKLALLAPQWLSDAPIPIDLGGPLGSYRLVPVHAALARWLSTVPEYARDHLIPEGWFDLWAQFTLAEETSDVDREQGKLRATNGPIQDIRTYWRANNPYYRPGDIRAPVLLLHGEWDIDVPLDLARAYFEQLTGASYRRWVEIGQATHLALLESNRMQAYCEVADFFDESFKPE
ncbi:pimeloyl-ACP methyl ester carboxylesterase [Rhizobium pisi]|uniref:Alpha/beta fold hydrolase n=1 Tax=Rhizobium pisi TaxID=574561 RepID=A0A427N3H3_9HYPH|nr:alpha/beta fold hydrolase [Rhizobium pisi]MBB3135385.1 pimeloyl-ACP methyl ester carboxylesterase [Rhizobium pisi]RSB81423.1 alpha/beta fold hydrolase [Rhizobium pisi]TCA41268.1 alpha/beta fold hydrolase [Rhizobium pisi]